MECYTASANELENINNELKQLLAKDYERILLELQMHNKLLLDSLKVELVSINQLLKESAEIGDVVGKLQYNYRQKILKTEIEKLEKEVIALIDRRKRRDK